MANWNINNHRRPHDTDEEWHVMSEFMTAHKSRIPEARLVCLAQVLKNVLFYKCRYPPAVMQQIDSLSKGIKDKFSAKRKGQLTRYFVGASDATKQSFEARSARNAQKHQDAKTKKSNLIKSYNFVKSTNEEEKDDNKTEAPSQNTDAGDKMKSESEETKEVSEKEEESKTESTVGQTPKGKKKRKRGKRKKKNLNADNKAEKEENGAEADSAPGEIGNKMKSESEEAEMDSEEEEESKTESTVGQTPKGENGTDEGMEEEKKPMTEPTSSQGMKGFKRNSEEDDSPSKKLKALQALYKPVAFQSSGMQAVIASQTQPVQQNPQESQAINTNTRIANAYPTEQTEGIYKDLGNFVLYTRAAHVPAQAFCWSCDMNCVPYQYMLSDQECRLFMKGKEIVNLQRKYRTKSEIKNALAEEALKILRRKYYTINVKPFITPAHQISREDIANGKDPNTVPETSVGFKLLKLMGWSGGGLGKDQTGITEPIRPIKIIGRRGLGTKNPKTKLETYVRQVVKKIATGQAEEDFAFSPEFTKDERAVIHMIANSKKIKSKSYGKGDERFLVLSPKMSPQQLLEKLLRDGENNRYSVTPPEN